MMLITNALTNTTPLFYPSFLLLSTTFFPITLMYVTDRTE